MTKEQYQVINFMNLFKQQVFLKPTVPSEEVRHLRARLILEEAMETIHALGFFVNKDRELESSGDPSLLQIADGLADLHYVGYCGTGAACGIDMDPVFAEVHRSNMSKMWSERDLKQQKTLYPTGVVEKYGDGLYRILVDGKVIKSPSYSPADIKGVLAIQMESRKPR